MAAGTRTAPDFTGSATKRVISISVVDAANDVFTQPLYGVPITATDAQVEAIAAAYQAATQASLYEINDLFSYRGAKLASNAATGTRDQASDGVNVLFRDSGGNRVTPRIVAPLQTMLVGDTEEVDPTATVLTAFNTAYEAAATGYTAESAQYTSRAERSNNPKVGF